MSPLSRNTKRRLALYGGGAALALALLLVARLPVLLAPKIRVRNVRAEADAAIGKEAARLLIDLVRIDSSNPPGRTREAILFLARFFECEEIPFEIVGDSPERPVLVARLRGATKDGALLLLGHIDVVPPGDLSKWDRPPFAGERGAGQASHYLIGRGTLDMKGQVVASMLAMADLKRHGVVPLRDVVFVAESAEETFEEAYGIGWILDRRPDLLDGVTDAINEGGVNEVLGADILRYGIEVLQKAILSATFSAPSREALDEFRAFLVAKDRSAPLRLDPAVREFLRFVAPTRSYVWGRAMLGTGDSLLSPELQAEMPEVYRSLFRDAIVVGRVGPAPGGGFSLAVARLLLPGSSVAASEAELAALGARARARHARPLPDPRRRGGRGEGTGVGDARRRASSRPLRAGGRRRLRPERPVHLLADPPRPRNPCVRVLAVQRQSLRCREDPQPERADQPSELSRRGGADPPLRLRVRPRALVARAATLASEAPMANVDLTYYRIG